jgi:hypothetical protein
LGSFIIGVTDWPIERLWLYLIAGAMLILMGMQLSIFWVIMRVLKELVERKAQILVDLRAG